METIGAVMILVFRVYSGRFNLGLRAWYSRSMKGPGEDSEAPRLLLGAPQIELQFRTYLLPSSFNSNIFAKHPGQQSMILQKTIGP